MFWWGWSIYDKLWHKVRGIETEDIIDALDEAVGLYRSQRMIDTEPYGVDVPDYRIIFSLGEGMTVDNSYERELAFERISKWMKRLRPGRKMYEDGKLTPIAVDMDQVMDKAAQMCREMEKEIWTK